MNKTLKKSLVFTGLGIDVAATVFLLTVAIIMIAKMPTAEEVQYFPDKVIERNGQFIGTLQLNPTLYFWSCVFPLILLFAANIVGLFFYVKYIANKKAQLSDLSAEQKAALREELLRELNMSKEAAPESNDEVEAAPEVTDSPESGGSGNAE